MAELRYWSTGAVPNSGESTSPERIRRRQQLRPKGRTVANPTTRPLLNIDVTALQWMDHGACAQTDPEAFFPDNHPSAVVREICESCPVRQTCFDYAMEDPTLVGVWGATTASERDRIRGTGRAVYQDQYRAMRRAQAAEAREADEAAADG